MHLARIASPAAPPIAGSTIPKVFGGFYCEPVILIGRPIYLLFDLGAHLCQVFPQVYRPGVNLGIVPPARIASASVVS
jgi:hypothetical protein